MFEGTTLLGEADTALLRQIQDQEMHDRVFNEITEQEYLQGLLAEHRQAPNLAFARDLSEADMNALTDTEAIDRLIQVEAGIARAHALRARLVALVGANRPASADRPDGRPGAAAKPVAAESADQVAELLDVSEWLSHELQMAHPYSRPAALDLVESSLVLTGRLTATLGVLATGRIDYRRAHILTDLLGTCSIEVAHTVEAMVLPKAAAMTPGGLASAVRRALARVDAAALRRRHARARRSADVGYWPTGDGMARLIGDLPLPVAAACTDAISRYADIQRADGDGRPIGQIRTEILTDLILRPWETSRPAVSAEITVHLTIPATSTSGARLDERAAAAEVNRDVITVAQCRELLGQLQASRLFLALHDPNGGLTAVATPAQLRRAGRRRNRRDKAGQGGTDGPGLGPPSEVPGYRPTHAQDRHVRTRDRSCRHFGCTRKAVHCDIDHHRRHPEGATAVCNLCCYCRTHHRLKHQAPGWTRDFGQKGTLTITTPTGVTRSTRPPGPEPDWPRPATPKTNRAPATNTHEDDDPPPF